MARIYYSCLKIEHKTSSGKLLKAGTLFSVQKHTDGLVACSKLHELDGTYYFPQELCRKIMIEPTLSESAAMEESFLICEANYC